MYLLFRIVSNLLGLSDAQERRRQVRQDLETTATIQRELKNARGGGQDYFLQRDLRLIEEENKRQQK